MTNKGNRRVFKLVILFLSRWINWSNGCLLQARGVLTSKKAPSDHTNASTLFRWDLEEDREVTLVARIDRQSSLTRFNINIIIPSFFLVSFPDLPPSTISRIHRLNSVFQSKKERKKQSVEINPVTINILSIIIDGIDYSRASIIRAPY